MYISWKYFKIQIYVYFLGLSCDITFNWYVLPMSPSTASATIVTGLHVVNGQMYHYMERIESLSVERCLEEFCASGWNNLTNHYLLAFDSIIFLKACLNCLHTSLPVEGFVDSLYVFQEVLPGSKCYKLETLVQECSSLMYKAHSALEDVQALQSLVAHLKIISATLLKNSFSVQYVVSSIHYKDKWMLRIFAAIIKYCSNYTLRNIAQPDLTSDDCIWKRRTRGDWEYLELNILWWIGKVDQNKVC